MTENSAPTMHERFYGLLLDIVRADHYPSTVMLDMLERGLTADEREELVDVLLEKIADDRFPSMSMLQRLARISL